MLDLEISNTDNCEKQVSENVVEEHLTCNDSEIVILFLHLCQIYGDRTEEDFLLDLAQKTKAEPGLYESLIKLNKIMVSYGK